MSEVGCWSWAWVVLGVGGPVPPAVHPPPGPPPLVARFCGGKEHHIRKLDTLATLKDIQAAPLRGLGWVETRGADDRTCPIKSVGNNQREICVGGRINEIAIA